MFIVRDWPCFQYSSVIPYSECYPYKPVSGPCLRELSEFCLPLLTLAQAKPLVSGEFYIAAVKYLCVCYQLQRYLQANFRI